MKKNKIKSLPIIAWFTLLCWQYYLTGYGNDRGYEIDSSVDLTVNQYSDMKLSSNGLIRKLWNFDDCL